MGKVLKDKRILATRALLEKYISNPDSVDISDMTIVGESIKAEIILDGNPFTYFCHSDAEDLEEDSGIVLSRTTYSRTPNRLERELQAKDKSMRTGATPPVYKYACETTWEYIHLSQFKPEYQKEILKQVAKSKGLKTFEEEAKKNLDLVSRIRGEAK